MFRLRIIGLLQFFESIESIIKQLVNFIYIFFCYKKETYFIIRAVFLTTYIKVT